MKNLYALLVGINDYRPPIDKLNGCINDLNQIEGFIVDYCRDDFNIHIRKLEDSDATYGNIIDAFRSHLRQAGPDDVAWFHFSGHGSEEYSADEFRPIEPNGKDQTLICYDSRTDSAEHLADKELAVLLHEVANQDANGAPKESPPHIVVSLDCCHSGSGTRSAGDHEGVKTRNAPTSGKKRQIDSYIDGFYASQSGQIQVPSAKHVVLSACESVQLAGDLHQGGAFTTGLVRALRKSEGRINYADLFMQTRSSVKKIRKNQTPQFDTIDNFNPYVRFLAGTPEGSPDRYEVVNESGKWYVKCGAIHGLPTDTTQPIELDIFKPGGSEPIGSATIKSVGAIQSVIDLDTGTGIKQLLDAVMPGEDHYRATLRHLPAPPEHVHLSGEDEAIERLISQWDATKNILWEKDETSEATLSVVASNNKYEIRDLTREATVYHTTGQTNKDCTVVIDALGKIVKWRRFITLTNENRQSRMSDIADFEIQVHDTQGVKTPYSAPEIKLYASTDNSDNWKFGFFPVARLQDVNQQLYFYLFYLNANYGIECTDGEIIYRPEEHRDISTIELPLWKLIRGFGPGPDEPETTSYFKLLVTTEQLDHQQFQQGGLGAHREGLSLWNPGKISDDWAALTTRVTIIKEEDRIAADREVQIAEGAVKIRPHGGIQANISVASATGHTRSNDPADQFPLLQGDSLQMMSFGSTRSAQPENVIELTNLRVDDPDSLENNPLDIVLPGAIEDDSMVLPIAFDGEFFRVIGDSVSDGDETVVHVRSLPEVKTQSSGNNVDSPFSTEQQDRSLFSALKLSFFKLVMKQKEVNSLKWADILGHGRVVLRDENLGIKVSNSKRILIALHGLAGDSKSMLKETVDTTGREWFEQFDCILAYEYESLNTPIDQTALLLKERLNEAGINDDDGKHVTILAHSIGGLVARWMIERSGGTGMIDECILVGTPHAGSLFGKIEQYRKTATQYLDLAINFVPNLVPFSGYLLKGLRTIGDLTGSLGQLDPSSEFINMLNSSDDPHVSYILIGGDASDYEAQGTGLSGMIEKMRVNIGRLVNRNEPHDLFASVYSTKNEEGWQTRDPKPTVLPTVSCHHFNYFAASDTFVRDTSAEVQEDR